MKRCFELRSSNEHDCVTAQITIADATFRLEVELTGAKGDTGESLAASAFRAARLRLKDALEQLELLEKQTYPRGIEADE